MNLSFEEEWFCQFCGYESQLTAWPSLRYSRGTQAPPKPKLQKTSLTTFLIFTNIFFLCSSTTVKHVLCMWWHSDGCQEERLGSRGGFLVTLESSCQMSPPPASDSTNSNPSNAVLAFRRREPYIFKKSNYTKCYEIYTTLTKSGLRFRSALNSRFSRVGLLRRLSTKSQQSLNNL